MRQGFSMSELHRTRAAHLFGFKWLYLKLICFLLIHPSCLCTKWLNTNLYSDTTFLEHECHVHTWVISPQGYKCVHISLFFWVWEPITAYVSLPLDTYNTMRVNYSANSSSELEKASYHKPDLSTGSKLRNYIFLYVHLAGVCFRIFPTCTKFLSLILRSYIFLIFNFISFYISFFICN